MNKKKILVPILFLAMCFAACSTEELKSPIKNENSNSRMKIIEVLHLDKSSATLISIDNKKYYLLSSQGGILEIK